ncbi:histidine kinase [Shewanella mangrovi]|uniref:histidine kinase n=1 Tax=Shewanella mangrovi TaxID=1515746 RepID=A0A094JEC9_9GAMM|nr:HAMP domain-containing sensor histidine kinase [Shewanella mangrovi]KFZ37612.1 histidine kinase [Shewanella mangrovi]
MTLIIGSLLYVVYRQLAAEQKLQVEQHLISEAQRYQQLALTVDRRAFAAQIRTADSRTALIAWQAGLELLGSLSIMPEDMPLLPETKEFPILVGSSEKIHILTGGIVITRYGPILIATRTDQLAALITKFVNVSLTAMALTILLTFALGYLFSKGLLRRLVQYNRLSERIEQGYYNTRLPVSERNDEFDMLAGQFNRVLDSLEHNLHAVRGVTDNIAHDMRTPLSHLRIGVEQLPYQPAEQLAERCGELTDELDHCLATFNAMLALTRIEEGQQDLELAPVRLQELCDDLLEMAEALAEEKQQQLTLETSEDCVISGDKHLLFQALFNLVDNAIKYAGEGASISIRQQYNVITIADNGPGIPSDARERVFERLVRLDPSRHEQGSGLGLSMVKAILSRHHATIDLSDNQPGLLVTLTFKL